MLTIDDLKPGERFIKWDGAVCVLVAKHPGRAVIRVESAAVERKAFVADAGKQTERQVEFHSARREYEVALGCEVRERL